MPRLTTLLIFLVAFSGCGPRLEVARDRLLAEADRLIGEIEVKRREIDPAVQRTGAALGQLKRSRIEVQVRASQISCDLTSTHDRLAQADQALARLRELLARNEPVEIAGTTYTPSQLQGMAGRMLTTRKSLVAKVETLRATKDRLENIVAMLKLREQDGQDRLDALKSLPTEIDTKTVALKAVRQAAEAAESVGAVDFEALERQVRDLEVQIDGELAYHEEMLKQATVEARPLGVILTDTGDAAETIAEIDKLLGDR